MALSPIFAKTDSENISTITVVIGIRNHICTNINIPDPAFKAMLLGAGDEYPMLARNSADTPIVIDVNNDGEIQVTEALAVWKIEFHFPPTFIATMEGIQYFTNLRVLTAQGAGVDVSKEMLNFYQPLLSLNNNDNLHSKSFHTKIFTQQSIKIQHEETYSNDHNALDPANNDLRPGERIFNSKNKNNRRKNSRRLAATEHSR